jgi:hypothetical protein
VRLIAPQQPESADALGRGGRLFGMRLGCQRQRDQKRLPDGDGRGATVTGMTFGDLAGKTGAPDRGGRDDRVEVVSQDAAKLVLRLR